MTPVSPLLVRTSLIHAAIWRIERIRGAVSACVVSGNREVPVAHADAQAILLVLPPIATLWGETVFQSALESQACTANPPVSRRRALSTSVVSRISQPLAEFLIAVNCPRTRTGERLCQPRSTLNSSQAQSRWNFPESVFSDVFSMTILPRRVRIRKCQAL